uniref:Putative evasin 1 n=1 Tax=Amblyomma triste TaxID=251400 RepID=A0A023G255_AMBTT
MWFNPTNMRLGVWLASLLLCITLTACQDTQPSGDLGNSTLNATGYKDVPPEVDLPNNETSQNGSDISEVTVPGIEVTVPTVNATASAVTMPPDSNSPAAVTDDASSITVTTTTSAPTSMANASTVAEASQSTTRGRRNRKKKPKTTTPRYNQQGEYGTVIDRRGCLHKALEANGNLYTATCTAQCGRWMYPVKEGTRCLLKKPGGGKRNKRGKKCHFGKCVNGSCKQHRGKPVTCRAPRGIVHYYDDESNYYDYDGIHYDSGDDGSFENNRNPYAE